MDHFEAANAIRSECLCFRARKVSRVLTRLYDEALRPLGIQATQLTLLSAIAAAGETGQTMPRLTGVLGMDPTTLSRNLRPLEKARLVDIGRKENDRRVRVARLTPKGERLLSEALPRWRNAQRQVVASLGEDAAADLRERFDATSEAVPSALSAESQTG